MNKQYHTESATHTSATHTSATHTRATHTSATQVPHIQVPHKCHTHKCHTHKCHTHKCHTQQVPHPQVPHTTSATHNKDDTHIVLPVVVFVVVSPKPGMAAGSGVPQCLQFLFLKKNTKQVKHDIFISQNTLHIKRGVTITNHQSPSIIKHHQASSSIIAPSPATGSGPPPDLPRVCGWSRRRVSVGASGCGARPSTVSVPGLAAARATW
jgi:hypothetical protein